MSSQPIAKKALGQHWLNDKASLEAICQAGGVKTDDQVLEIGPGTGELTKVLVEHGALVTALEYDESLIETLQNQFQTDQVKIIQADIRTHNLDSLPKDYKLVANIPYYLTAYLLRLLTETTNKPAVAALLVQKEVAQRVASRPGRMSFISVAVQLYFDVSLAGEIPAKLFTPPPKVDSQILILTRLDKPHFDGDYIKLLKFVKTGFSQPRKTLANNLSSIPGQERVAIESWLNKLGLKPNVRAQELALKNWHDLYNLANVK